MTIIWPKKKQQIDNIIKWYHEQQSIKLVNIAIDNDRKKRGGD
jgi:hypothetical protein